MADRFLKLLEVMSQTGYSKSRVYGDINFPKRVNVGKSSFWLQSEIDAWMKEAVAASRSGGDQQAA